MLSAAFLTFVGKTMSPDWRFTKSTRIEFLIIKAQMWWDTSSEWTSNHMPHQFLSDVLETEKRHRGCLHKHYKVTVRETLHFCNIQPRELETGYWQNPVVEPVLWSLHQLWKQAQPKTNRKLLLQQWTSIVLNFVLPDWDCTATSTFTDELHNSMATICWFINPHLVRLSIPHSFSLFPTLLNNNDHLGGI